MLKYAPFDPMVEMHWAALLPPKQGLSCREPGLYSAYHVDDQAYTGPIMYRTRPIQGLYNVENQAYTGPISCIENQAYTGPISCIDNQAYTGPIACRENQAYTGPIM